MYHLRGMLLLLFLITFCSVSRADGPLIEKSGDAYRIAAGAYTASVDATGTLTSVIVGGVEFLRVASDE